MGIVIITAFVSMLFMFPILSASGSDNEELVSVESKSIPPLNEGLSTNGVPAKAEENLPDIVGITPWGTPVQVSPDNGAAFAHYPRTTTLAWQRVTGAIAYRIERQYQSGVTWYSYPNVTVSGINTASYTFAFVGDQAGRWRVSAYNGSTYSTPSPWWYFSYRTRAQMPTPILTNPAVGEVFDHWPRTTTLSWKMIPAAVGYKVEIQYYDPGTSTWKPYSPITLSGYLNSKYTFNFIGAQQGRWRVTTLGYPTYFDSAPSDWRYFRYGI